MKTLFLTAYLVLSVLPFCIPEKISVPTINLLDQTLGATFDGLFEVSINQINRNNILNEMSSVDFTLSTEEIEVLPNPFTDNAEVLYALTKEERVAVKVFDILGKEIITLIEEVQPAGKWSIIWDGRDRRGLAVERGIYIIQIQTGKAFTAIKTIKK